ncbi:MAG: ATP synthase F1 subunit gamma [Candidatus Dormibacteraeota bacterium]|uniref:ATP synthase gamma chain n=1 Tax=Candidatus Amunia macphersoniae TaxID=3127014 RepID=A0A934KFP7_9BACT|nr:ATP synthase F1 subunit gamma [Candidatus Dormibacteraeota bacterium]
MASLRDLRRRIKSVKSTQKITKAMELVAAAKMRRAQERVQAARPYSEEITNVVADLFRRSPEYKHPYLQVREVNKRLIILVTSDRGLVGALNSNNVRQALREMNESPSPASVVTIGRKGRDVMRRLRKELVADRSNLGDRPSMGDVLPAIRVAMEQYENGDVDQVDLVFARFISAGRQQATVQRVLPVEVPEATGELAADFLYEPEPKDVLDALLPRYVEAQVYQGVLENLASQQAAQMVAMRNASDNASDLITDLTLTANTVRQTTITTELMEIVGGAAALQG